MTSYDLLWLVFHFFVVLGFAYIFIGIIAMGVYDIRKAKTNRRLKADAAFRKAARFRVKPTVTILVPAYNEALVIERCLQSLLRLDYK